MRRLLEADMYRRQFLRPLAAAPLLPALSRVAGGAQAPPEGKPATAYARPYLPDLNWPQLPPGLVLGAVCSVAYADGFVWLLQRGNPAVLCLDREGRVVKSWGAGQIQIGHHIRSDHEGHIWVADIGHHQVLKFTPEGRLIMALGKKDTPGAGTSQFNEPTDVAILPSGDLIVTDGYGNFRVMIFTAAGKLIHLWGVKGREPNQFDTPHDVVVDVNGRIYISDRGNSRIQVFDSDTKFIEEWREYGEVNGLAWGTEKSVGLPCGPEICGDGLGLWGTTGRGNEIFRIRSGSVLLESYGGPTSTETEVQAGVVPPLGRFNVLHSVAVDEQMNLYVAEVRSRRVQRLIRQSARA